MHTFATTVVVFYFLERIILNIFLKFIVQVVVHVNRGKSFKIIYRGLIFCLSQRQLNRVCRFSISTVCMCEILSWRGTIMQKYPHLPQVLRHRQKAGRGTLSFVGLENLNLPTALAPDKQLNLSGR